MGKLRPTFTCFFSQKFSAFSGKLFTEIKKNCGFRSLESHAFGMYDIDTLRTVGGIVGPSFAQNSCKSLPSCPSNICLLSHLAKLVNLRPGPTVTGGVTWLVDLCTKKVSYAKPPLTEFEFDIFTQSKTHLTSKEGFSQSVGGGRVGYPPFRQLSFLWCIFGVLENIFNIIY